VEPVSSSTQSTPSPSRASAVAAAPSTLTSSGLQSDAPPGSGTALRAATPISILARKRSASISSRMRGLSAQSGAHEGSSSMRARSCSSRSAGGKPSARAIRGAIKNASSTRRAVARRARSRAPKRSSKPAAASSSATRSATRSQPSAKFAAGDTSQSRIFLRALDRPVPRKAHAAPGPTAAPVRSRRARPAWV
jgi:hypothetical protein